MSAGKLEIQEEMVVIFHSALLGRTDVLKNAIASIRASGHYTEIQIQRLLSTSRPEDGATPLHIATHYGHTDVIRTLLNAGVDVSLRPKLGDFQGKRAYDIAQDSAKATYHVFFFEQIAMGHVAQMEQLLSGGIPLTLVDESASQDSALHWAASFGHVDMVYSLLSHGFPVDFVNADQQTALHIAVKAKAVDVIALLLREGCAVDLVDNQKCIAQDYLPQNADPNNSIIQSMSKLFTHPPEVTKECHQRYLQRLEEEEKRMEAESRLSSSSMDILDNNTTSTINGLQREVSGPVATVADALCDDEDFAADYTSTVVYEADYEEDVEEDDDKKEKEDDEEEEEGVFLVFWPPVFRQKRPRQDTSHHNTHDTKGLKLFLEENLVISVVDPASSQNQQSSSMTASLLSLVSDSGLLRTFDELGFQVQVKRHTAMTTHNSSLYQANNNDNSTATNSDHSSNNNNNSITSTNESFPLPREPHILLLLDNNRCPLPQSYILTVTSKQVKLIAHDITGLLYACYTLMQLISLHSQQRPASANTSIGTSSGFSLYSALQGKDHHNNNKQTIGLVIPFIFIEDRPTTAAIRAISLPYRPQSHIVSQITDLQRQMILFSQLRINRVYVYLEPDHSNRTINTEDTENTDNNDTEVLVSNVTNSHSDRAKKQEERYWRDMQVLQLLCHRLQLELVPTVVLTSLHDTLPVAVLRHFSQPLIHLIFLYHGNSHTIDTTTAAEVAFVNVNEEVQQWYVRTLLHCQQAAFRSVQVSFSQDMKYVLNSSAKRTHNNNNTNSKSRRLRIPAGLSVWETNLAATAPVSLQNKPLLAQEMYLAAILKHVQTVEESGDALLCLPFFSERDYMYPMMLQKFHVLYYAGLAWQRSTALDMLGDPRLIAPESQNTDFYEGGETSGYDGTVLREVVRMLLFPSLYHRSNHGSNTASTNTTNSSANTNSTSSNSVNHSSSSASHAEYVAMKRAANVLIQSVLLQSWSALCQHTLLTNTETTTNSDTASTNKQVANGNGGSIERQEMYEAEFAFWQLLQLPANHVDFHQNTSTSTSAPMMLVGTSAMPTRAQASLVLKTYRRLLAVAQWRPNNLSTTSTSNSSINNSLSSSSSTSHNHSDTGFSSNTPAIPAAAAPTSFFDFLLGRSTATASNNSNSTNSENAGLTHSQSAQDMSGAGIPASTSSTRLDLHTSSEAPVLTILDTFSSSTYAGTGITINNSILGGPTAASKSLGNDQSVHSLSSDILEVDEVFALLHLLAIVSKVVLQTDHAFKQQQLQQQTDVSSGSKTSTFTAMRQQVQALAAGTRSDVANLLLEALHTLAQRWQYRFQNDFLLRRLRFSCVAALPALHKHLNSSSSSSSPAQNHLSKNRNVQFSSSSSGSIDTEHGVLVQLSYEHWRKRFHRRFLVPPCVGTGHFQQGAGDTTPIADADSDFYEAELPALALFKLLCEGLVLPKTVEEFLLRIFTH